MKTRIAVMGSGREDPTEAKLAFAVGRGIAEQGAVLLCGGLSGVMREACRGAKEAGGLTIGFLPGTEAGEANPYIDVPIPTGIHEARNVLVASSGEAAIAIGGALGTLTEIGFALKQKIPVIGLSTWSFDPERFPENAPFEVANDAEDAVARAFARIEERRR